MDIPKRLLIVEDDAHIAELLRYIRATRATPSSRTPTVTPNFVSLSAAVGCTDPRLDAAGHCWPRDLPACTRDDALHIISLPLTAAALMLQLASAKTQVRLKEYFNRAVLGPKLLIVDEMGYLPFGREHATLFFNVFAERHERASSMVLKSNLPFMQWACAFADAPTLTAAMLDRLLQHARIVQISGDSCRLQDKRKVGQTVKRAAPVP